MYYAKSTTLIPFNSHRPMKWVLSFPFPFLRLKNCVLAPVRWQRQDLSLGLPHQTCALDQCQHLWYQSCHNCKALCLWNIQKPIPTVPIQSILHIPRGGGNPKSFSGGIICTFCTCLCCCKLNIMVLSDFSWHFRSGFWSLNLFRPKVHKGGPEEAWSCKNEPAWR